MHDRPATPIRNRTIIAMLDRGKDWTIVDWTEVRERASSQVVQPWDMSFGFEDVRLSWNRQDGLCATASASPRGGGKLEIVALRLDGDLKIVGVDPLRGAAWAGTSQKNWCTYVGADELRMLHSPLCGGVHDRSGRIVDTHEPAGLPTIRRLPMSRPYQARHGAIEIRLSRRRDMVPRADPRLALRGGSQLVARPGKPGRWIGIGHGHNPGEMWYWHQFYEVDAHGDLQSLSLPFKLAPDRGIEFAAGLAISPERNELVVSYGVEDDTAWLGVARLDLALRTLHDLRALA